MNKFLIGLGVIVIVMYYYTNTITYNMNKIPGDILSKLSEDGFVIVFTSSLQLGGKIDYNNKIITIKNRTSLLHEIGHYVDYKCGRISDTEEFRKVFDSEKYNIHETEYNISSNREYFAESFKNYILYENKVKHKTPKTYEYILKCLEEV